MRIIRRENERDYPKREDSLTKPTWSGFAGATLTYESDGRPWRDACLFLALSGYRSSDSESSGGISCQSGSSCPGFVGTFYPIERCRSISPACLPAVHNQRGAAAWRRIHPLDPRRYQDRKGGDRSSARRKHSSRSVGGN